MARRPNLRKRKDEAAAALAKGKLAKAAELYAALAKQDPHDLQLRVRLGDVLRKLGRDSAAIEAYATAAEKFAQEGLTLRAIAVYKLILEIKPHHSATQARLAELSAERFGRPGPDTPRPTFSDTPRPPFSATPRPTFTDTPSRPIARDSSIASGPGLDQPVAVGRRAPVPPPRPPMLTTAQRPILAKVELRSVPAPAVEEAAPGAGLELIEEELEELQEIERSETVDDLLFQVDLEVEEIEEPMPAWAENLSAVPLFSDLERPALDSLVQRSELVRREPGEAEVRQSERGDSFYVVLSGKMRVVRKEKDGTRLELATLQEGAFFGEMALLTGAPRSASVVAVEESELLRISASLLRELVSEHPTMAGALRRFYRQRLLTNVMATSPLFRPLDRAQRRALIERFTTREVASGQVIVEEGAAADSLYVVLSGKVHALKGERVLGEIGEGEIFGEIALLTGKPATATCRARTRGMVLRLPGSEFRRVLDEHPAIESLVEQLAEERKRSIPPDDDYSVV